MPRQDMAQEDLLATQSDDLQASDERPTAQFFDGTSRFSTQAEPRLPRISRSAEGVSLNFQETDIRAVLEAVLGDMLQRTYFLDPDVQGTMTLQSSAPVPEDGLLLALESALRVKDLAIVDSGGVLNIMPLAKAPRNVATIMQLPPRGSEVPGFSVQVVPLRYTSVIEMQKVLQPFAPQGGILRVDQARNLLVLAGTSQEMGTMLQTVETFDVDWLAGTSFALFNPQFVEADILTDELLQIFGDIESPIAGMVRFFPIPRLNTILAVSSQPAILRDVETWIQRLDQAGGSPGRRIYVYNVRNGRAVDLANALGSILGSTSAGNQAQAAAGQASFPTAPPTSITRQNVLANRTQQNQPNISNAASAAESQTEQVNVFDASGLRIVPIVESNSLLILASPSEYGVIHTALDRLDIRPRQVLIEATLVEVTLSEDLRYGVQWFFEVGDNSLTFSEAASGAISSQFPGLSYLYTGSANARTVLNALASKTDVNLLSAPKLMVLNNQSATLQIGDQVPIATQSAVSVVDPNSPIVNSVQFRDTGVILTVTPRINEGGLVMLDISQEVSDVVPTTTSGIDSPTIQQRKVESSVIVQSGDTIALGGLIRESVTKGNSGVPILKDIPLLGNAFRTNDSTKRRTELIILITPRIARDTHEMQDILKYLQQEFRNVIQLRSEATPD